MDKKQETQIHYQNGTEQAWLNAVEKALKGESAETLKTKTKENIILKPLYLKEDSTAVPEPGVFPYIRGTAEQRGMWKASQSLNHHQTLDELVLGIKKAAGLGHNSFYLSDFKALSSSQDVMVLADAIKKYTLHFMIDFEEAPHWMTVFSGRVPELGEGGAGCDPYEALMKGYIDEPGLGSALNWMADYTDACGSRPDQKTIWFKSGCLHEAGADAVQELACTFAKALDFLNWCRQNGKPIQLLAGKTAFQFSAGSHFFMETAKLRAARLIWSSILSAFGETGEAQKMYTHVLTSSLNKSKLDVHVNLLRTTTEAFSAVIGNADAITVLPFDEVIGGSVMSERIAGNIHYLLSEESLLEKVSDPGGGSWYLEALTKEISEKAWEKIMKIEAKGGFVPFLSSGELQSEISGSYQYQAEALHLHRKKMIGVNDYANPEDRIGAREKKELRGMWPKESFRHVRSALANGQHPEFSAPDMDSPWAAPERLAVPFERLRESAQEYEGGVPAVQIAVFGTLKEYKPRLDFLKGLLASGGIGGAVTALDMLDFSRPVFLCGTGRSYIENEADIKHVLFYCRNNVFIAGEKPENWKETFPKMKEVASGMNRLEFLEELQRALGVKC
ncbi:methylmalonyl-CoA mutase family protein [Metabacillus sp. 113a]|uniref:methylmalonyl-CoA mutase family protein n=1 Tax=Metabacillus sp. 113a TaxID=3404706 RepID=UPI003CEEE20C